MSDETWLIDMSVLIRIPESPDVAQWNNRIERGLVHITNVTRLEIGYSARSGLSARRDFREAPLAAMPVQYLTPNHRRPCSGSPDDLGHHRVIAVLIDGCASFTLALRKHWRIMAACEPSISAMSRTR